MTKVNDSPSDPGPKPPREPGCLCGDWTIVNGHWTQVFNPRCPVHSDNP